MPPMNTYETFFHLAVSSAVTKGSGGAWGLGGWKGKKRGCHARIASSIECPDMDRTPVGARTESRRNAIIVLGHR